MNIRCHINMKFFPVKIEGLPQSRSPHRVWQYQLVLATPATPWPLDYPRSRGQTEISPPPATAEDPTPATAARGWDARPLLPRLSILLSTQPPHIDMEFWA